MLPVSSELQMIGVVADPGVHNVVREFFELFKTPWQFYRKGKRYEVLVSTGGEDFERDSAGVVLTYSGTLSEDVNGGGQPGTNLPGQGRILAGNGFRIPVYGRTAKFSGKAETFLRDEETGESAAFVERSQDRMAIRVGYDLFSEVARLLTEGQPEANAALPALELHIDLLRRLIIGSGVPLIEIPPVPSGYRLTVCLTHDVDHPSIRKHCWDHTTFGFLYRATVGSLGRLIRGRSSVRDLRTNWAAAAQLPLVQTGLAADFWSGFDRQYAIIERDLPSTFFVIPFANRPGKRGDGPAPAKRAARYGAGDIADVIRNVTASGNEIALHGIDAWRDITSARKEIDEIRRLTGAKTVGVRMHWLYFDPHSLKTLDAAGANYDSTVGYNGTIGFKSGATQVFKPLEARSILELPLHVMDTALYYPSRLGLTQQQAKTKIQAVIREVTGFGGCLTINWHDRSLSPERLWGAAYSELVQELRQSGAWFATASAAVEWFRKRRAVKLEGLADDAARAGVADANADRNLPGLRLRLHNPQQSVRQALSVPGSYLDLCPPRDALPASLAVSSNERSGTKRREGDR